VPLTFCQCLPMPSRLSKHQPAHGSINGDELVAGVYLGFAQSMGLSGGATCKPASEIAGGWPKTTGNWASDSAMLTRAAETLAVQVFDNSVPLHRAEPLAQVPPRPPLPQAIALRASSLVFLGKPARPTPSPSLPRTPPHTAPVVAGFWKDRILLTTSHGLAVPPCPLPLGVSGKSSVSNIPPDNPAVGSNGRHVEGESSELCNTPPISGYMSYGLM
jgi:hypothetical protein